MVIGHLQNSLQQMREIDRILHRNGLIIFRTPNSFGYTTFLAKLLPDEIKNKVVNLIEGRVKVIYSKLIID